MKQTLIPMILITLLLFTGCSHKSPKPTINKPPLTTTQKVAGTVGGLLLGISTAAVGGMFGLFISGSSNSLGPSIGFVLGGAIGVWEGYTIGTILTE